jgi:transposase-like protein
MSDYPTIETGAYTWHPVIYLTTLLRDLQGCMRQETVARPEPANKTQARERIKAVADKIIQMKSEGLSNVKVGKALGVSAGTVYDWWKQIKEERGIQA